VRPRAVSQLSKSFFLLGAGSNDSSPSPRLKNTTAPKSHSVGGRRRRSFGWRWRRDGAASDGGGGAMQWNSGGGC